MPYYPNQIKGLLAGVDGGTQYEAMIKRPGAGLAFTAAMSGCYLLMLAFLLVGNVAYFAQRITKGEKNK
jgi:hypothetical protein